MPFEPHVHITLSVAYLGAIVLGATTKMVIAIVKRPIRDLP